MIESNGVDEQIIIETGDVLMLEASVIPFVLLVTARVNDPDPVHGSRMIVCWLEHPEKSGHSDWAWESSLRVKAAWRKLASAA